MSPKCPLCECFLATRVLSTTRRISLFKLACLSIYPSQSQNPVYSLSCIHYTAPLSQSQPLKHVFCSYIIHTCIHYMIFHFVRSNTPVASSRNLLRQHSPCFFDELHLPAQHALLLKSHHHHDNSFIIPQDAKPRVQFPCFSPSARLGITPSAHSQPTRTFPLTITSSTAIWLTCRASPRNEHCFLESNQYYH